MKNIDAYWRHVFAQTKQCTYDRCIQIDTRIYLEQETITWAILDDGRSFFDDIKTTIDFTGQNMTFPQSILIDILNSVRYVVPVERVSFLDKWKHRKRRDAKGGKGAGPGHGSSWTND